MFKAARPTGPSKGALEAAKRYHDRQLKLVMEDRERRAENFRRRGNCGELDFGSRGVMLT